MKNTSKSLFIAVAAFAVTASGVHAFNSPELLQKAGLTTEQVQAVQTAQELKLSGNISGAQTVLQSAGVTKTTLDQVKKAAKEAKRAVQAAVKAQDYQAFKVAVKDSPLGDVISTEADFEQFVAAHNLRAAGEFNQSRDVLSGLGVPEKKRDFRTTKRKHADQLLSAEQRSALQVAQAANDKPAVRAIFAEVGIDLPDRR